jgi:rSAM/selenodomain-associated transferase 2
MTISVIIPTLNESAYMSDLINFLTCGSKEALSEIIVVDGGSTDNTVELARSAGAKVIATSLRSRAAQMNLGAAIAKSEILYFIHADVKLISTFIDDIFKSIEMGYDAGCYAYIFDSDKVMLRVNAYFTKYRGIFCGGGDQTLFIRKEAFDELKGFNTEYCIMEDFEFYARIQKKFRFRLIPKRIKVSARKYENNNWMRVQLANLIVFTMFLFKFPPRKIKLTYNYVLKPIF